MILITLFTLTFLHVRIFLLRQSMFRVTGHYLSPGVGGRGAQDFRGDYLIFRRPTKTTQKSRSRGGSLKTLEGFRGGTTQICWENEHMGRGDRESYQKLLGGITSVK